MNEAGQNMLESIVVQIAQTTPLILFYVANVQLFITIYNKARTILYRCLSYLQRWQIL